MLAACAPQVVGVVKMPDYSERVGGAVLVLQTTQVEGATQSRQSVSAGKSLATFNDLLQKKLPELAKRDGFLPFLFTVGDPNFTKDGYRKFLGPDGKPHRHFLIIRPYRWETKCGGFGNCRTTTTVITSVFDSRLGKEVWQVSMEVPEKSNFQDYDSGDIEAYWSLLIGQLKGSQLL